MLVGFAGESEVDPQSLQAGETPRCPFVNLLLPLLASFFRHRKPFQGEVLGASFMHVSELQDYLAHCRGLGLCLTSGLRDRMLRMHTHTNMHTSICTFTIYHKIVLSVFIGKRLLFFFVAEEDKT